MPVLESQKDHRCTEDTNDIAREGRSILIRSSVTLCTKDQILPSFSAITKKKVLRAGDKVGQLHRHMSAICVSLRTRFRPGDNVCLTAGFATTARDHTTTSAKQFFVRYREAYWWNKLLRNGWGQFRTIRIINVIVSIRSDAG